MMSRRLFLWGVAAATCGLAASSASAQSYPQRPVKIVAAVLPGTGIDLVARTIADKISANLKQTFIVENRAGAAGNLGAEAVARSVPDGHMLLAALNTTFTASAKCAVVVIVPSPLAFSVSPRWKLIASGS